MPSSGHIFKQTLTCAGRALRGLAFAASTIFLTATLCLQAILLIGGGFLDVPDAALEQLHEELEKHGWRADYDRLRFQPPRSLLINGFELARDGESDPMIRAHSARIDFSLSDLFRGEFPVERITIYGGSLLCPARLSPTGLAETIVRNASGVASTDGDTWRIEDFNGKILNVLINASGTIPPTPERIDERDPADWQTVLFKTLASLVREREIFERFANPSVRLGFEPTSEGEFTILSEGWAKSATAAPTVKLFMPHIKARVSYKEGEWIPEDASWEAQRAEWESILTIEKLSGKLSWNNGDTGVLPDQAEVSLARALTPAGSLEDIRAAFDFEAETKFIADFHGFLSDGPFHGEARFDWVDGNGVLELTSLANPTPVLQSEIAREMGLMRDISFDSPPFIRATATVEDWQLTHAHGRAHARNADIDGVFMHSASAEAELFPDRFVVPEMFLSYGDFDAEGSFDIHLQTKEYRLFFKGAVRPLHISSWFRDWWTSLWQEFEFTTDPLRGDIDLQSVIGDPDALRLEGKLSAEYFHLRGVPFTSVSSGIAVAGANADLFNIDLSREEGTAAGSFQYWPCPATRGFGRVEFEGVSTLDPIAISPALGEAAIETFSRFEFTRIPYLSVDGVFHGPSAGHAKNILIDGSTSEPLKFQGLPLDSLKVTVAIEDNEWRLSNLDAGFAGGELTGRADKWVQDDFDRLGFTLFLRGMNLKRTLEAIAAWQTTAGMDPTNVRELEGLLDMYIDATGVFGDFQSYLGEGSIRIREADLAEVHLLGILSRILSVTPLGFTSLQFNEADAQFRLNLNRIHFDSLQLRGPTSAIRAAGDYLLGDDDLDFGLRVYLLKESKIPLLSLLLSPLLEPLAHALEVRLTGPLADPQWRFLLGPRNVLKTLSGEEDPGSSSTE